MWKLWTIFLNFVRPKPCTLLLYTRCVPLLFTSVPQSDEAGISKTRLLSMSSILHSSPVKPAKVDWRGFIPMFEKIQWEIDSLRISFVCFHEFCTLYIDHFSVGPNRTVKGLDNAPNWFWVITKYYRPNYQKKVQNFKISPWR